MEEEDWILFSEHSVRLFGMLLSFLTVDIVFRPLLGLGRAGIQWNVMRDIYGILLLHKQLSLVFSFLVIQSYYLLPSPQFPKCLVLLVSMSFEVSAM